MRALLTGVTGIRSHQVRMDVIGNNIANVNTTGFKASRVTFSDVLSETISAGSTETSPQQVGLGVGVASTDLLQDAGSLQLTGRSLDLAVEGEGFFLLRDTAGQFLYTRAGNFDWNEQGYLVNPGTGQRVQGWLADATGAITNTSLDALTDIRLLRGSVSLANPTTSAVLSGNLDASADVDATFDTALTAYDSLGRAWSIPIRFTKTADNEWSWAYQDPETLTFIDSGTLTFNTDGTLPTDPPQEGTISITLTDAEPLDITVQFGEITQASAGAGGSEVLVREVDGAPMGVLESVHIEASGLVVGVFSNGMRRNLAQLALATFANPGGLLKAGNSTFAETASSGAPQVGVPDSGGRGRLLPGNLEMSNVDLSTEFTNMILTQRGFQANTRVITTVDQMMEDVVNLRR